MVKLTGLGRGLDALLSTADTVDDRLTSLPIDSIRPGKYQPRSFMDEGALDELAMSIRAQGIIQPLVVREVGFGDYELIAGERRWHASRRAGLTEVPVVIKSVQDEVALAISLIENIQRQELDPIEEALGLKRLIDEFGLTHEAVAETVGRSRSAVSNMLRLLVLPEAVQAMLHQRRLEMGHARALLALPVEQQEMLAKEVIDKGLSVREVERRVQQKPLKRSMGVPLRNTSVHEVEPLAEQLSECLGVRVSILRGRRGNGKLVIEYATQTELECFLEKLKQD